MAWVGKDLTALTTPTPAMGLPRTPSSLALGTSRDGCIQSHNHVINNGTEEYYSQDDPLRDTIPQQHPPGRRAADHNPLAVTTRSIPYPLNSQSFKPIFSWGPLTATYVCQWLLPMQCQRDELSQQSHRLCSTHCPNVEVLQRGALQPFPEVVLPYAGLCLEDGKGDGPGEGKEALSAHPEQGPGCRAPPSPHCRDPQGFHPSHHATAVQHYTLQASATQHPFTPCCHPALPTCCHKPRPFQTRVPLSDRRALRFLGDDEAAAQPCILHHLVPQELCQALGSADGGGFLLPIVLQLARHGTVL